MQAAFGGFSVEVQQTWLQISTRLISSDFQSLFGDFIGWNWKQRETSREVESEEVEHQLRGAAAPFTPSSPSLPDLNS